MDWDPPRFSVSATTRAPRRARNTACTTFHSRDRSAHGGSGRDAGTCRGVRQPLRQPPRPGRGRDAEGRDTLFDIDWQGGQQIRNSALGKDVVSVFILPPSIAELDRRLRGRGQDSDAVIAGRMAKSRDEISHWAEYDYVLVNDDVDRTFAELRAIVTAERLRRDRQPGLSAFVRGLNTEFEDAR
jgi:guanylate kinase